MLLFLKPPRIVQMIRTVFGYNNERALGHKALGICIFDGLICQYLSYYLIYNEFIKLYDSLSDRKPLDRSDEAMVSILNERSVRIVHRSRSIK